VSRVRQVRWACPAGHPAVLGPSKPRRMSTCRYCLLCSSHAAQLVERTAPALERQRDERAQKLVARRAAKKQKTAEQLAAYYTVVGINLLDEMRAALKCAVFKGMKEPTLIVRNSTRGTYGRAWYNKHQILVNRMPGLTPNDVRDTLLHELAHLKTGRTSRREHHGVAWKTNFRLACEQFLGVRPRVHTRFGGEVERLLEEREKSAASEQSSSQNGVES
jgi:predicted SprT family Zn-dependent metalloprotease